MGGAESAGQEIEVGEGEEDAFRTARHRHTAERRGELGAGLLDEALVGGWGLCLGRWSCTALFGSRHAHRSRRAGSARSLPEESFARAAARGEGEDRRPPL